MRDELRGAFSFFDKDGSGQISMIELEAGMALLSYPSLSPRQAIERVQSAVRDMPNQETTPNTEATPNTAATPNKEAMQLAAAAYRGECAAPGQLRRGERPTSAVTSRAGSATRAGSHGIPNGAESITFDEFARAFAQRVTAIGSSGELALRFAFSCFDNNNDGVLTNGEFRDALGRLVTVPMSAETMDALINQLDADGDGTISIDEWIAFLQARFTRAMTSSCMEDE